MPKRAIVLVDIQNSQIGRDLGPNTVPSVVSKANELIAAGRESDSLIVYIISSNLASGGDKLVVIADDRPAGKKTPSPGWDQLIAEVLPPRNDTDPIVTKRGWDAFYGSSLDLQLRRHGIEEIVICGISTNFGVEGTARAAIDRGYRVTFAEDAMTSWTSDLHNFAVQNILPKIGKIRSTSEICETLVSE